MAVLTDELRRAEERARRGEAEVAELTQELQRAILERKHASEAGASPAKGAFSLFSPFKAKGGAGASVPSPAPGGYPTVRRPSAP